MKLSHLACDYVAEGLPSAPAQPTALCAMVCGSARV